MAVLIRNRIVGLPVDYIIKRCDLRELGCNSLEKGGPSLSVFMIEAYDKHDVACFCGSDEHVPEESDVLPDIEESQSMLESIFSDEKSDLVRWGRLKIAVVDVKNFVEEASYVEAQTVFLLLGQRVGIFILEDPSAL